ncbi:hypothetical protein AC578_6804 [Pseudocercospora eumusae]|uniref:Uncharacterized protein n=1 Tax=Pseudocercospora eumusae TaxID=321146 RepID=A0A139GUN6_9PEZI|nr:hypothetical protein AC578_6804 [Pseudocercospora eumusae]
MSFRMVQRPSDAARFKFLIHTFSQKSHTLVVLPVVRELIARGHEVVWLGNAAEESTIIASGARFIATREVAERDKELMAHPVFDLEGVAKAFFGDRLIAQAADLQCALAEFAADCLLNDFAPQGAAAVHALGHVPVYATISGTPLHTLANPPASAIGTLVCRPQMLLPLINPQRETLGLPPLKEHEIPFLHYSPFLHLQASCAKLEFNHAVPETMHFIGPLAGLAATASEWLDPPEWWVEVTSSKKATQVVVGLTQGTLVTDPSKLIMPALEALMLTPDQLGADVFVLVATPHAGQVLSSMEQLPARYDRVHVHVSTWVPYEVILPHCSLFITNGGYGGVMQALIYETPVICSGTIADHADVAARVASTGVGIALNADTPSVEHVRESVIKILHDPTYKAQAAAIGAELKSLGGARTAADLLEDLILTSGKRYLESISNSMSYTRGHIQADDPRVIKAYDYRTVDSCCAYLIPHLKPHYNILDVGCGPGNITVGLAELCPQGHTIGIDISPGVIDIAISRYSSAKVANVSFQVGDAEKLSQMSDASFDVVHAHGCLLHVENKIQALEAFWRVCKPGGIIAVRDALSFGTIWSLKPDLPGIREQWAKQRDALIHMGSDPDTGLKKKEWAQQAGYERNGGRLFITQSPQRMEVALRNFEGEAGEGAINVGFLTRDQVDRFKQAWDEWENTEGHELVCPAADMLYIKGT